MQYDFSGPIGSSASTSEPYPPRTPIAQHQGQARGASVHEVMTTPASR